MNAAVADTKRASKCLWHIGITVSDLDRSLAFYRDIIGFEPEPMDPALGIAWDDGSGDSPFTPGEAGADQTTIVTLRSDAFDRLTNNQGTKTRSLFLTLQGFRFQLIEYVEAGSGKKLDLLHSSVGNPHFAFWIEDVEGRHAELSARDDVEVTSEIVQITPTTRSFYVNDPDGLPIELAEDPGAQG